MRFNRLFLVVPFLCFTALIGCGPSCESLCDKAKDDDCKDFDHDDCMHGCIQYEDMQKDTNKCDDEQTALIKCMNESSDICKIADPNNDSTKCDSESKDFETCVHDYCDEHPSRDYCSQYKTT